MTLVCEFFTSKFCEPWYKYCCFFNKQEYFSGANLYVSYAFL